MSLGEIIALMRVSLLELLILAAPVLLVAVGVGLTISIIQAITSIQEQTITFVPKMITIVLLLIFLGPWLSTHLINFTQNVWGQMYAIVR